MFLLDIVFYFILAFYFDHADDSNRGKTYSKFFFLQKSFWCGSNKSAKIKPEYVTSQNSPNTAITTSNNNLGKLNKFKELLGSDISVAMCDVGLDSVKLEKEKLERLELEGNDFNGLRILGIKRDFVLAQKCCSSNKILNALKNVIYINL